MAKLKYIASIMTGVRFDKLNKMLETVKQKAGTAKSGRSSTSCGVHLGMVPGTMAM